MKIYNGIEELIGNTPLVRLCRYMQKIGSVADIIAKVEYFNPAGSIKDRAALQMIIAAENSGKLCSGATIIEPTSGNTGIGLAMLAAERGYNLILTMPETMSVERRNLLKAYGAEIVLTEGKKGMSGSIEKAKELLKQVPGSFMPSQFVNPANAQAHYNTTGPEIWHDTEGHADILVAGVGTGGTLTGTGKYLKEQNPDLKIVAVEPDMSAVLSGESAGAHKLQGIGAGFIPEVLEYSLIDSIMKVSSENAYSTVRTLVNEEGFLCGISSGAALYAAGLISSDKENIGKNIIVILPDTGERYLSVENLF